MAAQYKTLDGDTDGARPDTCLKESRGNGKCDRKHPLMDRHTKKKKKRRRQAWTGPPGQPEVSLWAGRIAR